MKKSRLLHIVSIIIIILSTIYVVYGSIAILTYNSMTSIMEAEGLANYSIGVYTFSLIGACVELAAGIAGVMYRSRKTVLILGILYCLYILGSLCFSAVTGGFSVSGLSSCILPALFMWGWYQSK